MKRPLLALVVLLLASTGKAETTDASSGNALLGKCKAVILYADRMTGGSKEQLEDAWFCLGWIGGAASGYMYTEEVAKALGKNPKACMPSGAPLSQAARVFVKWLEEHPGELHKDAFYSFMAAMNEGFPCEAAPK